ncbi:expressed unknown protein [Seminavis robusta]|uniref:Uncharacterized protein n=1 Tax=Seminavis robusta TaxID=568900 RepID=A0A9N8HMK4_9STRA|nr:expressed unknown protein [Seminavis robusta]|eukprot:Sro912_g219310.1 n/a (116) ;mRNA; r:23205-23552
MLPPAQLLRSDSNDASPQLLVPFPEPIPAEPEPIPSEMELVDIPMELRLDDDDDDDDKNSKIEDDDDEDAQRPEPPVLIADVEHYKEDKHNRDGDNQLTQEKMNEFWLEFSRLFY